MDRSVSDAKSVIAETEKYVGSLRAEMLARVARHEERIGELQDEIETEGRLRAILVGFLGEDQMVDRSKSDDDPEMETAPTGEPHWARWARRHPATRQRRYADNDGEEIKE